MPTNDSLDLPAAAAAEDRLKVGCKVDGPICVYGSEFTGGAISAGVGGVRRGSAWVKKRTHAHCATFTQYKIKKCRAAL